MSPKYKFIYFNLMGGGEPIRMLFGLAKVDFEDVRFSHEEWFAKEKGKSEYPWGVLPVLYEDDKDLCQSLAILRYLGKKFGRAGKSDWETAKCDEYVDATHDVVQECVKYFFEPDETKKAEMKKKFDEESMPKFLSKMEEILKKNGTGLLVGAGAEITYADVYVAHYITRLETDNPGCLKGYLAVMKHLEIVFGDEGIKEWIAKRPVTTM